MQKLKITKEESYSFVNFMYSKFETKVKRIIKTFSNNSTSEDYYIWLKVKRKIQKCVVNDEHDRF